ncbi:MAG: hydroxyacylglutathione hydrolase [Pseudomonadota bacterium]
MHTVTPVPAFDDNYLWLIQRDGYDGCAIVDPGDAKPVIAAINERGLTLDAILITHKHADHTGGIRELKSLWPNATVYGPRDEPIPELEVRLGEGDALALDGLQIDFKVLDVPGHTEAHIAYFGHGRLFCGDTLFAGGCGRVFSGTHDQLSQSLQKIAALPADTLAYCGHEYTMANLGFAQWVEPDSSALAARVADDASKRKRDEPTVPSSVELELATNPFMRTGESVVIEAAQNWIGKPLVNRDQVFFALREWKDREYD